MEEYDIYRDIATRCGGTVFIGVVGPVRTGKSTLIAQMMEKLVLPHLPDGYGKERMVDELPQSGSGRTIMTTQPRFVPAEPVSLRMDGVEGFSVRFVDCVGYVVDGAMGAEEEGQQRMVRTPWFDHDIPFEQAAEMGTRKVIAEHSTIGIVVTTDGSITGMPRSAYAEAEERVVNELKELNKPFIVVLNTTDLYNMDTQQQVLQLEEKYGVPVVGMDVLNMTKEDIAGLLERILYEFPLRCIEIDIPGWMQALPREHELIEKITQALAEAKHQEKMKDYPLLPEAFENMEGIVKSFELEKVLPGQGRICYCLTAEPELFYKVLGQECGCDISGDSQLMSIIKELVEAKREYDKIAPALAAAKETGYGVVAPSMDDMVLEEPEMVRQGGRYGVKLKASAPSLHLIRADVKTEVSPVVGSEQQGEEMVRGMLEGFESDTSKIWESNIFGKSLHELVQEGLSGKLVRMPAEAQKKMQMTVERIVNEGGGGLICILL